jgi:hypothetical protein
MDYVSVFHWLQANPGCGVVKLRGKNANEFYDLATR